MFRQLVQRVITIEGQGPAQAVNTVLTADPLDLLLHMEQVWHISNPWSPNPQLPAGPARQFLWSLGRFDIDAPIGGGPTWDHLGYSYTLENTRAVQILRRVVREFRSGEGLGIPSVATQQWLNATETILFGASNPLAAWLSTSTIRPDAEAVRRNAYWRLFGLDLAFGGDDNRPPSYDKANAANGAFLKLFEELLYEVWKAIINVTNFAGANETDDDRIYTLADELCDMLRARRQQQVLGREELAAAAALGWVELTLNSNTPVVVDLRARATSPSERLRLIGERVGLAPHSKSESLFALAQPLSVFLRTIEAGFINNSNAARLLYINPTGGPAPQPIGDQSRRLITEWSVATGKNLKTNARPLQVTARRQDLVPAR